MWLVLLLLTGCGVEFGFGGQDLGNYGTTDLNEPTEAGMLALDTGEGNDDTGSVVGVGDGVFFETDVSDLAQVCDPGSAAPEQLDLVGGVGTIAVIHSGLYGNCCANWVPLVQFDSATVEVTYADLATGLACDCDCLWTLAYTIEDVPAGAYVVYAGALWEQVVVE